MMEVTFWWQGHIFFSSLQFTHMDNYRSKEHPVMEVRRVSFCFVQLGGLLVEGRGGTGMEEQQSIPDCSISGAVGDCT